MAEKEEIIKNEGGTAKPTETKPTTEVVDTPAAPVGDETGGGVDAPDVEDISDLLQVLNTFKEINGDTDKISEIPAELRGVLRFTIEKMQFIRELYEDPLYQKLLDDLADQKEDGKTPSVLVAVARNVPLEDIQDIADNENYEDIQGAVDERLLSDKTAQETESALYDSFEKSMAAGKAYGESLGYNEEEINELISFALDWFKILGDGNITENEWKKVDNMRNYDNDTNSLRSQIPPEPVKEVLPDKAAMSMPANTPTPKQERKPDTMIDSMANAMGTPSYLKPRGSGNRRR